MVFKGKILTKVDVNFFRADVLEGKKCLEKYNISYKMQHMLNTCNSRENSGELSDNQILEFTVYSLNPITCSFRIQSSFH